MLYLLGFLCAALVVWNGILLIKIAGMRRAADEICAEVDSRLGRDTNVGIDITISDDKMRCLAAEIDRQMRRLRKEHIRYLQGDRELKEAVTNISHDLRTPLTAICGYMELLEQEEATEKVRVYLAVIQERIDTMKQLTEELFRYSLVVSANQYEERESVDLNRAVEDSIAAYYGALKEAGITPRILIPKEKITRQLNKAALSRILANVIGNAVKYSDGDLEITLLENGHIVFRNHAKEMDQVLAERLFDRFYTIETGKNATGLGLSIARALTEQMGGKIWASYEEGCLIMEIGFDT
ncbi:sensor histidine kinase [Blautia sp.]|uniref:sensor histidine kinase n=1 Tax=Blautia sp. TaxID=1955243 RepID=UPI00258BC6CB|nr:HAMP domain-containing sensor histidine kinase [Blautia sp.]